MFLVQLYRRYTFLFILFVCWLGAFVFLNLKWGLVASPVYQYGMFSKPMHIREARPAYRIVVNGVQLNPAHYSFAQRDILYVSLDKFQWQQEQNRKVFHALGKFLPVSKNNHSFFNHALTDETFAHWYRQRVSEITGVSIQNLEVYHEYWWWNDGNMLLQSSKKLNYFD